MNQGPTIGISVTITAPDGTVREETISPHSILRPVVVIQDTVPIQDLAKRSYKPVGQCIYCGLRSKLSSEHIIPYGLSLGGTLVLPDASCSTCASITGRCEQKVLRGSMRPVRVLRRLRSRSKHAGAPGSALFKIVRAGIEETVRLPLDQYPILLPIPIFPAPGYLTGKTGRGIDITGLATISYGPRPEEVLQKLGGGSITLQTGKDEPAAFARMLAKIAYSYAWGEGALQKLSGPSLTPSAILGNSDDIGNWVGTLDGPVQKYPGLLHRLSLHEERGLLIASVQLFADSETPSYGVILGSL